MQFSKPPGYKAQIERTQDVQKASWTSSERLMYVQFTSFLEGVFWVTVVCNFCRITVPTLTTLKKIDDKLFAVYVFLEIFQ